MTLDQTGGGTLRDVRLVQLCELADIVFPWGPESSIFALKDEIHRVGLSLSSPSDGLIFPMISAFRQDRTALFGDWPKAGELTDVCSSALRAIQRHGSPIPDWLEAAPFAWEGSDTKQGMESFAHWLSEVRPDLGLLNFETFSSFYLSPICLAGAADHAIAQLELIGLEGSVVNGSDRNASTLGAIKGIDELATDHGFTASEERIGRFYKPLDATFSKVIDVFPKWDHKQEIHVPHIRIQLANHDMNDLGRTIMHDERMVRTFPTIDLVKSTDLNAEWLDSARLAAWLAEPTQAVNADNVDAAFKRCLKYGSRRYAPALLSRLMSKKWPKSCDTNYLNRWDRRVADASKDGIASLPTYARTAAIAASVRNHLQEHDIPYDQLR